MILSIDCETGGLGLDKSLLSISMIFCTDDCNPVEIFNLNLKPNDGVYHCTGEALGINKINLVEHDANAVTYKEAGTLIYWQLNRHYGENGHIKVLGKNVYFDLLAVWDKLIARATWEQFCSYQVIDISSVWAFLEHSGIVPHLEKTSLTSIADYLQVKYNQEDLHTAQGDAMLNIMVYQTLIDVAKHPAKIYLRSL
jgi:hypothetical protein